MPKIILVSALLSSFLLVTSFSNQEPMTGKEVFEKKCSSCHGKEGTKSLFGAKNLHKSTLTDSAIVQIIERGKKFMPSYKKKLTTEEIKQVKEYVKTLRN